MSSDNMSIDTAKAEQLAGKIEGINDKIVTDFANVEKALTELKNSWSSSAGTTAIEAFEVIKQGVCTPRENQLLKTSMFLKNIIGQGYELTEIVNENLADYFK